MGYFKSYKKAIKDINPEGYKEYIDELLSEAVILLGTEQ